MSKILELREKRAKAWDTAKAFLDNQRGADGLISATALVRGLAIATRNGADFGECGVQIVDPWAA